MNIELLLVVGLFCAGLAPLAGVSGRFKATDGRTRGAAIAALWLALGVLFLNAPYLPRPQSPGEKAVTDRPVQIPTGDYVGSASCQTCHPHQHSTWHDSYHRTMTQAASEESVLGNFNNVHLKGVDLNVRLFKKDKTFLAQMTFRNPDFTATYPIVMTTGSHNRQAYWMASGQDSRLMILPYMYLKAEKRWIPRHSGYINPMCLQERPELAVFQADFGRWAQVCMNCHATHAVARPHDSDRPAWQPAVTRTVEFGISCEACHGPGAEHVRANSNPLYRYQRHLSDEPDPTIVNPSRLPHDRASEVCGQCHSVTYTRSDAAQKKWVHHGHSYRPGDNLARDPIRIVLRGREDLMPADRPRDIPDLATDGSFWPDGMIRASGREYNGLLDTPCYQRGTMSCLSCHQMHQSRGEARKRVEWADDQLRLGMDGNQACLQCHDRFGREEELTRHTHHPANSSGSNCYNCHMPYTSYGILKAIRSHQIDSPSVKASLDSGRPNACNQCHQDKTLAWTAHHLERRYGIAKPKLSRDEQEIAASALWALRGDAGQRALMAWSYGWKDGHEASGTHWQAPYLAQLLEDRYDAVRFIAHRSLQRLPSFENFEYDFVGPLEHRAAAHQRALKIWESWHRTAAAPDGRSVLIDGPGRVLQADFQRLWKLRDDRPMAVNE